MEILVQSPTHAELGFLFSRLGVWVIRQIKNSGTWEGTTLVSPLLVPESKWGLVSSVGMEASLAQKMGRSHKRESAFLPRSHAVSEERSPPSSVPLSVIPKSQVPSHEIPINFYVPY